jgi:hypothetical protein
MYSPTKIIQANSSYSEAQARGFHYQRRVLILNWADYAAEDFIAVDGLQDREFRVRYNARYNSSKAFRRMFLVLTFWWISGVFVYLGCLSAISTSISPFTQPLICYNGLFRAFSFCQNDSKHLLGIHNSGPLAAYATANLEI